MSRPKERVTVTLDPGLVAAATAAVRAGTASSVSAWINAAMAERAAKERRLAALAELLGAYEAEYGEITAEEIDAQRREDRRTAIVVRGSGALPRSRRRGQRRKRPQRTRAA